MSLLLILRESEAFVAGKLDGVEREARGEKVWISKRRFRIEKRIGKRLRETQAGLGLLDPAETMIRVGWVDVLEMQGEALIRLEAQVNRDDRGSIMWVDEGFNLKGAELLEEKGDEWMIEAGLGSWRYHFPGLISLSLLEFDLAVGSRNVNLANGGGRVGKDPAVPPRGDDQIRGIKHLLADGEDALMVRGLSEGHFPGSGFAELNPVGVVLAFNLDFSQGIVQSVGILGLR